MCNRKVRGLILAIKTRCSKMRGDCAGGSALPTESGLSGWPSSGGHTFHRHSAQRTGKFGFGLLLPKSVERVMSEVVTEASMRSRRAFTLIEILVVVAIIALL